VTIIPLLAQALYDLERCQMLSVAEDRKNLGMVKLISYKATTKNKEFRLFFGSTISWYVALPRGAFPQYFLW
jgi:hypothetical protein